jgi:hypothetical protein
MAKNNKSKSSGKLPGRNGNKNEDKDSNDVPREERHAPVEEPAKPKKIKDPPVKPSKPKR